MPQRSRGCTDYRGPLADPVNEKPKASSVPPVARPDLSAGYFIGNRFQIVKPIGFGAAGAVYKALDTSSSSVVALKVLSHDANKDERTASRFLTEARILYRLKSPYTVRLLSFGNLDDGRPYLVMEYVKGGSLDRLLKGRRLGADAALQIARQICLSLDEAHEGGVIHRDLKPANVLLDDDDDEGFVSRLVDFGLARLCQGGDEQTAANAGFSRLTKTTPKARVGTPVYMSPEQALGKKVDKRADLYSVGVILYEMLTGHVPFASQTKQGLYLEHLHAPPKPMRQMAPDVKVDPEIEDLVMVLLAKKPEERLESGGMVARIIDDILSRRGIGKERTVDLTHQPAGPRPKPQLSVSADHVPAPKSQQDLTRRLVWVMLIVSLLGLVVIGLVSALT